MKILLVEDNEILAKGLIYSLEQKKYQVIHTLNVENTLKILKTEKIDLAISPYPAMQRYRAALCPPGIPEKRRRR